MCKLVVKSRADSSDLRKAACSIEQAAWNDLGYLNYTRAHFELYAGLLDHYADFQLCLVDEEKGYPVASANCVPVRCDGPDDLPPEGWDWVVENAAECKTKGGANMLGALAISVPAIYRSKGYARLMIRALLDLAQKKGMTGLVAPVRPSRKAEHPDISIYEYIRWCDDAGRAYDPWLRSHMACGAKIVRPCERSMVVHEHIGFWENWTKKSFNESGYYTLEGALVPVEINLTKHYGRYEEPNVWMVYAA